MLLHRSSCGSVCLSFPSLQPLRLEEPAAEVVRAGGGGRWAALLRFHSELLNGDAPTLPMKRCVSPTNPENTHGARSL